MWPLRRLYHFKKFAWGPLPYGVWSALGDSSAFHQPVDLSNESTQLSVGKSSISYLKLDCVVSAPSNSSHRRQNVCPKSPWAGLGSKFFYFMHAQCSNTSHGPAPFPALLEVL